MTLFIFHLKLYLCVFLTLRFVSFLLITISSFLSSLTFCGGSVLAFLCGLRTWLSNLALFLKKQRNFFTCAVFHFADGIEGGMGGGGMVNPTLIKGFRICTLRGAFSLFRTKKLIGKFFARKIFLLRQAFFFVAEVLKTVKFLRNWSVKEGGVSKTYFTPSPSITYNRTI